MQRRDQENRLFKLVERKASNSALTLIYSSIAAAVNRLRRLEQRVRAIEETNPRDSARLIHRLHEVRPDLFREPSPTQDDPAGAWLKQDLFRVWQRQIGDRKE